MRRLGTRTSRRLCTASAARTSRSRGSQKALMLCERVASLRLQQGPLEDGFNGLMPMMTDEGNADPELVAMWVRSLPVAC